MSGAATRCFQIYQRVRTKNSQRRFEGVTNLVKIIEADRSNSASHS